MPRWIDELNCGDFLVINIIRSYELRTDEQQAESIRQVHRIGNFNRPIVTGLDPVVGPEVQAAFAFDRSQMSLSSLKKR